MEPSTFIKCFLFYLSWISYGLLRPNNQNQSCRRFSARIHVSKLAPRHFQHSNSFTCNTSVSCSHTVCLVDPSTCFFSWSNYLFLCKLSNSGCSLLIDGSNTWDLLSINRLQKTINLLIAPCDKPVKLNPANTDVTNAFFWYFCGQIFTQPHSLSPFARKQTACKLTIMYF